MSGNFQSPTGQPYCEAIIQLNLAPLDTIAGQLVAGGFGEGIGAVIIIPKVGELRWVRPEGQVSDVDTELLDLVQVAKRTEDSTETSSHQKANAWDKLAQYPRRNPYKESAIHRRDQWRSVEDAEAKRQEQLTKACIQYVKDYSKLDKLLQYDENVVSSRDKEAYIRAMKQVYAPWWGELGRCGRIKAEAEAAERRRAEKAARDRVIGRMKKVPGGLFLMGANEWAASRPLHVVTLQAFEMDVTEVTVAAYKLCVDENRCTTPAAGAFCTYGPGNEKFPVNCVNWYQARNFCTWAGKRLPTEEEWEYAARGNDLRVYPWGNQSPVGRSCSDRREKSTCQVASFPNTSSPFGIEDMAGNVWEWVSNLYSTDYNNQSFSTERVARGGSWYDTNEAFLRSTYRHKFDPATQSSVLGFRCARLYLILHGGTCCGFLTFINGSPQGLRQNELQNQLLSPPLGHFPTVARALFGTV